MSRPGAAIGATLVALILVLPTQVTVRQLAMRLADVRSGEVTDSRAHAEGVMIVDHFASWRDDALQGLAVISPSGEGRVVNSGSNWFVVSGAAPGFGEEYRLGSNPDSALARLAERLPTLPITPAAVLLVILAGLQWRPLMRWLRSRWWRRVPVVGWLALAAILAAAAHGGKTGVKELLQFAEFAILAVVLGVTCRELRWRQLALSATVVGALLIGVVGLLEYWWIVTGRSPAGLVDLGGLDSLLGFDWQASRPGVRGTAASRNALAFYGAMVLPLLAVVAVDGKRSMRLRWAAVAAAIALLVCCQNLWLLLIGVAAATVAAGLLRPKLWLAVPLLALVVTGITATTSPYGLILADSAAIHRYEDAYGLHPQPMRGLNGDDAGADWSPWQQKAIERQAATNAVLAAPLQGYGLGRYQEIINQYYSGGPLPALWLNKPPVNLMERDAHALWLVLAVEGGVLLPILLMLGILARAMMALRSLPEGRQRAALWLALAMTLLAGGWVSSFMVRGLFGMTALLAVLATVISNEAQKAANDDTADSL